MDTRLGSILICNLTRDPSPAVLSSQALMPLHLDELHTMISRLPASVGCTVSRVYKLTLQLLKR